MADHHELPLGPQDLGDKLEDLLDRLAASGLATSPRDRINATRLAAALIARGKIQDLRDLKPHLAVLLARSRADRDRFMVLFDGVEPPKHEDIGSGGKEGGKSGKKKEVWNPLEALLDVWERVRPRLLRITIVLALIIATPIAWKYWNRGPEINSGDTADQTSRGEPRLPQPTEAAPDIKLPDDAALKRIAQAAERFEGAPTIDELAEEIAKASPIAWPAPSYAIRLNELSGLPRSVPLALYGADGKDGQTWARLALALERIERPGREPPFIALRDAAKAALAGAEKRPAVYALAAQLKVWYRNGSALPKDEGSAAFIATIQDRHYKEETKSERSPTPGEALDPHTIARALAIAGPAFMRLTGADAPWLPRHTAVAASVAPWWAPWLAFSLPIVLGALWALRTLALRRAYLRRRPPDLPPLHTRLVADAPSLARYDAAKFQAIARRLRTRTSRPTARLDVDASIAATLKAGGEVPAPVYAVERHNPEYLVLIERRSGRDQDAERLRTLVRRLEEMVSATVFYYRTEPSRLEPEGGGRALSIEQLESLYPEHRLVILGSGAGFLDPATLKPLPSVERLSAWSRRALLTPLGVAEWGSEELELSRELKMPIGRATLEGMDALSGMLGLEGAELQSLTEGAGDNLARPLPLDMRIRPERYLYNRPPPGEPAEEIVRQLRNYLDGRAFEWLAALAVYPAVQWDLTLYLGVTLPERPGGLDTGDGLSRKDFTPLYSEHRLAALTQLPWLREGIMPNWLRAALIAELSDERREEVRKALTDMIGHARIGEAGDSEATIKTIIARERERIGKEAPKDSLPPSRLMEDQVLLDFLAEGRQEDLEITGASWLDNDTVKSWVKRFGIPEAAAIGVAIAYGAAALFVVPKMSHGALVSGAWMPLILIGAGAILALAFADREPAYAIFRRCLFGLAAPALAFAMLMLGGTSYLQPALGKIAIVATNPLAAILAAIVMLLLAARNASRWLGIPQQPEGPLGWFGQLAAFILWTGVLLVTAVTAFSLIGLGRGSDAAAKDSSYLVAALVSFSLFILAWLASRYLPEKLPKPKPNARGTEFTAPAVGRRMALAMAPIVPALLLAFYVAGSSTMLEDAIPGGVTATAELPDAHLVALGGADGGVRIVDMSSGSAKLRASGAGQADAVSSLSFAPKTDNAPVQLWASYANGNMITFEVHEPDLTAGGFATDFNGSPSRVLTAIDSRGTFVTASETESGVIKLSANGGGDLEVSGRGPFTALAPAGDGYFAAATLDGGVQLFEVADGQAPTIAGASHSSDKLPGSARRLEYDVRTKTVIAYGDDGTVINLPASPVDFARGNAPRGRLNELALGPAIAWVRPSKPQILPQAEPKLVALVVGNSNYAQAAALKNAANDAKAAAKALYALGYAVVEVIDADRQKFRDELDKFRDRARDADVALFYFSGHAYASGGQNRMVPVDVGGKRAEAQNAIAEADILAAVAPARALKAVIIDSHDNKQLPKEKTDEEGGTRSLGSDDANEPDLPATRTLPPGTAMIYAAGEGTEAFDRLPGGSQNSPFTTALIEQLKNPNAPILDLLNAVQSDVRKSTNGKQKPVIFSNLTDPISITGRAQTMVTADEAGGGANMFLLSIGVSRYQFPELRRSTAASDAENFANALTGIARRIYPALSTTIMLDADVSRDSVGQRLNEIRDRMSPRDVLVIFMAGHGATIGGRSYFATPLFDPKSSGSPTADAIPSEDLARWLATIPGKGLLITDAGGFGTSPDLMSESLAFNVIAAAEATDVSFGGPQSPSVLTSALIEAMTEPSNSKEGDTITLMSLWDYVDKRVAEIARELAVDQRPRLFRPPSLPDFPLGVIPSKDQTTDANAEDPRSLSPQTDNIQPQDDLAFAYYPPGDLVAQDAGRGRTGDRKVYFPDIGFPIKVEKGQHAYMNSQIWGFGGGGWSGKGSAGGSERDRRNYDAMRLRDNYCEVRSHAMPLCPSGIGHQGQDIRPPTPENSKWDAIAVADGVISYISSWSTVRLTADNNDVFEYLQLDPNTFKVKKGDRVRKGDVIGKVSNYMSGPNMTTLHLHFNTKKKIKLPNGKEEVVFAPPYSSLIAAYRELKGLPRGIDSNGDLIVDPEHEIGAGKIPRPAETAPAVANDIAQTDAQDQTADAPQGVPSPDDTIATFRTALLALDAPKVQEILNGGWDADTPLDGDGNAALHVLMEVCEKTPNHDRDALVALARILLDDGATPALENNFKDTPLKIASAPRFCGADHPVVALLRDKESALEAQNSEDAAGVQRPYPTMPPLAEIAAEYLSLFDTAEIRTERRISVDKAADTLTKNRARYELLEKQIGTPWYFVGLIHGAETGFDFNVHLHNGDPLKGRTYHVPANRPPIWNPPNDWESSALDALTMKKFDQETSWTLPEILYRLEKYNGTRSRVVYGINTPYLWSFTQHYTKGKFVADNVWDPNAVSTRPGAAAILKVLVERGTVTVPRILPSTGTVEPPTLDPLPPPNQAPQQYNDPGSTRGLSPDIAPPPVEKK